MNKGTRRAVVRIRKALEELEDLPERRRDVFDAFERLDQRIERLFKGWIVIRGSQSAKLRHELVQSPVHGALGEGAGSASRRKGEYPAAPARFWPRTALMYPPP